MKDVLAVLSWWFLIQLLGLAAWPLAFRLLRFLPDRGYTASKPLGLLLTSFVLWLLGSLGLLPNNIGGVLFALAVVIAASAWALSREGVSALRDWLREHRAMVLVYEALFLVAMCGWAAYRATNPGINSTEKPMEFMFLNSILRSPSFPPQDAWLSGFGISYYYFGYVMMAVMTRLAGTAPGVAYNVSHGLWFALIAGGAFGAAYQISNFKSQIKWVMLPIVVGVMAAVFVVFLGNLEGTLEIAHSNGVGSPGFWKWLDIKDISGPAETGGQSLRFYWWWRASRVVHDYTLQGGDQEVIDEFPFFSFLNGDLHPHTLAYPFAFLAISLALNVYRGTAPHPNPPPAREREQTPFSLSEGRGGDEGWLHLPLAWYDLLLYAICLGALGFLNTWDFPIYLLLVVAAFALRRWQEIILLGHSEPRTPLRGQVGEESFGSAQGDTNEAIWDVVKLGAILGVAGFALYLPFYASFQSQARGILPNLFNATRFPQFLVMFGQFAVPGALFLLALAALHSKVSAFRFWLGTLGWACLILIGATILGLLFGLITPDARNALQAWLSNKPIPGLDPNIGNFVGGRLLQRLFDPWTALWLALAIVVIVKLFGRLVTQSTDEEDKPLANPSVPFILSLFLFGAGLAMSVEFIYLADSFGTRMNTVFKFYYQVWALWGVGTACAIGLILDDEKLWTPFRVVTGIVAMLLVVAGLVYPITAISTLGDWKHLTLNGTAWVEQSSPDEYAAIQWLNQNVADSPVILEAPGQSYHPEQSRVSAYTGLPTVLGWGGHELQWRGNYDEAGRREPDIKKIYTTRDDKETLTLLDKYAISYVYVGPVEREMFPDAGLQKFERLMDVVFRQGNVTIYKRR
jgi:YYY domain-containing protein